MPSMTSTTRRSAPPLVLWIAGIVLLAIGLVVASVLMVTTTQGQRAVAQQVTSDLGGSQAIQTAFQQQRYQRLNLISRIFATDQLLTAYLTEAAQARDEATLLDAIEEYQNLLSFDLAVVLDRDGVVLTRTDGRPAGDDLSQTPLVAAALKESKASGVWEQGDQLYHAVAVPLLRQFEHVGYIAVAYAINNGLAMQISRTGGTEVVYLANLATGAQATATTLGEGETATLLTELRRQGDVLDRVIQRGETASQLQLDLDDEPHMAFLSPLRDAESQSVGAAVSLISIADKLDSYQDIRWMLLGAGLAALTLGLLLAALLASRLQKPLDALATAAAGGARGELDTEVPTASGQLGVIADSLRHLFGLVRERQALSFVVGRVARLLPEPAAAGSSNRKPEAIKSVLVAVELRRLANGKIVYDPEDNLGRLARDIQRIGSSAKTRGGRVTSLQGHRVLVVFEGKDSPRQAMIAASEIMLTLSERENVFDEPNPPVVAIAGGAMIAGTVGVGEHSTMATAGLPVHLLESLMREAAPGDIYLSKEIFGVLEPLFQKAGTEVKAQRGLLSPQPVYVLTAEAAGRATGTKALGESTELAGGGLLLADVRPGTTLGGRFDVHSEIGASAWGVSFKAFDREHNDLVGLKLLRPETVSDAELFEHLKRVVARARTIRHANVLSVLDFGESERLPYISSEFVRGMSLAFMLDKARQLPVAAGIRVARQMAWGLQAAHSQQVMHGGLKPENVMVEVDGTVKLMDFGMARPLRFGEQVTGPGYRAPEQLEGRDIDSRVDLFAWGAVVYRLLTGQLPFPGDDVDQVRQAMASQEPEAPTAHVAGIPSRLEQILLRCLAKDPAARFASVDELVEALAEVASA